jgi:dihydroorotate dehydrogenase (NAD+) catalytic subunit
MNTAVELAPRHKTGLPLRSPILLACGAAGYGAAPPFVDASALGAVVTLPLGARARPTPPEFAQTPGGVVVAHGGPAAARAVLRRWGTRWMRADPPVIARLVGDSAAELAECAEVLEEIHEIAAVEWRADVLLPHEAGQAAARLRSASEKPLLVQIPLLDAAAYAEAVGEWADALVVGAPPAGTAWSAVEGHWVSGDTHGVGAFPLVLEALRILKDVPLPLIALGGIHTPDQAVQAIVAGATAVMLDTALYRSPDLPKASLAAIIREMENRALDDIRELIGRDAP